MVKDFSFFTAQFAGDMRQGPAIEYFSSGKKHGTFNQCGSDGSPSIFQTYEDDILVRDKHIIR